jgi:hypothetical protein
MGRVRQIEGSGDDALGDHDAGDVLLSLGGGFTLWDLGAYASIVEEVVHSRVGSVSVSI